MSNRATKTSHSQEKKKKSLSTNCPLEAVRAAEKQRFFILISFEEGKAEMRLTLDATEGSYRSCL